MAWQLGCSSGLPRVKQRPLLTTRPSITCGILVSGTWLGTRFIAHNNVELERVIREAAQSGGNRGKASDVDLGKDACPRHANG
jgi:hypothetical protein